MRARTLAVLYPNYTQIATLEGKNINRLTDLSGRVVSTGSPGSGTEVMALRLLKPRASTCRRTSAGRGSASTRRSMPSRTARSTRSSGPAASRPPRSWISQHHGTSGRSCCRTTTCCRRCRRSYGPSLYFTAGGAEADLSGPDGDVGVVAVANVLVVDERMSDSSPTT